MENKNTQYSATGKRRPFWRTFGIVVLSLVLAVITVIAINI